MTVYYRIVKIMVSRAVNFAASKNLDVKSKMFPHWYSHKYTWTSPDGKTHNQIEPVLTDSRWHSSILDVRSFTRTDFNTNHYMVVAKVRDRLAVSKQPAQKFDVERYNLMPLIELQVWKQYQIKISNRCAVLKNLNDSKNVNRVWENLKENIKISAKNSIKHGLMKNVFKNGYEPRTNISKQWKRWSGCRLPQYFG